MDYSNLLKRGWHITWNFKYLWWLGFLAALGGSAGGGGSTGGNSNFSFPSGSGSSSGQIPIETQIDSFLEGVGNNGGLLAGLGVAFVVLITCLLLFSLIMWFVRLAAEAGLIHGAYTINQGEKSSFGAAFAHGRQHMGTLFGVNLILKAPMFLVSILFACIALFALGGVASLSNAEAMESSLAAAGGTFILLGFCAICLLVPYSFIVALMYPIAQRGVVLGEMEMMDSVRHAWAVLKANVGEMLLLGVIFWFMELIFGIVSLIFILPILAATLLPAGISFFNTQTVSTGLAILAGVGTFATMLAGSAVSSVMVVLRSSTFTLAYLELLDKMKLSNAAD